VEDRVGALGFQRAVSVSEASAATRSSFPRVRFSPG
jgi:hypothetical protein